jgi:hypothetical protein
MRRKPAARTGLACLAALAALSCAPEEVAEIPVIEPLPARQQLIRLSVDLRGVHPSEVELTAIEQDPRLYALFVDEWLHDERFVGRVKEIMNVAWLTRTGDTYIDRGERGLDDVDDAAVGDVVGEEPLALLEYDLKNDLPYSTMVTAPHSMANPLLARFWGMDRESDGAGESGWQPATYRDGRPHSGMLSMNTIWQRYPSMGGNANRHRANAISKMLLCDDYLTRPIVLNRAAVDQLTIDPENAIKQNQACQSCHSTLDPLSANLFGFFNTEDQEGLERTVYRPENESEWRYHAGKEPGYYGRPTSGIEELGQAIANDHRFTDCAVETVFEGLTQRDVTDADWEELAPHADRFLAEGQNLRELVRSIVLSEAYQAGKVNDPELADRIPTLKLASPAQLEGIIAEKTGYIWTFGGRRGLTTNDRGLNVLMGGIDSRFVTTPSFIPSVGGVFVQERLAMAAGHHVAIADLDPERTAPARLLKFVTIQDTPEANPDAFEAQIRELYLQLTGLPLAVDATEPAALTELWKYQYSIEADPTRAWASVVTAVLRDPTVTFY